MDFAHRTRKKSSSFKINLLSKKQKNYLFLLITVISIAFISSSALIKNKHKRSDNTEHKKEEAQISTQEYEFYSFLDKNN